MPKKIKLSTHEKKRRDTTYSVNILGKALAAFMPDDHAVLIEWKKNQYLVSRENSTILIKKYKDIEDFEDMKILKRREQEGDFDQREAPVELEIDGGEEIDMDTFAESAETKVVETNEETK